MLVSTKSCTLKLAVNLIFLMIVTCYYVCTYKKMCRFDPQINLSIFLTKLLKIMTYKIFNHSHLVMKIAKVLYL